MKVVLYCDIPTNATEEWIKRNLSASIYSSCRSLVQGWKKVQFEVEVPDEMLAKPVELKPTVAKPAERSTGADSGVICDYTGIT